MTDSSVGDLILMMHQESSDRNPDSEQHTAQLHVCAVACWDIDVMVKTSRKLFNSTKDMAWARRAAWAEWVKVGLQSPLPASITTSRSK